MWMRLQEKSIKNGFKRSRRPHTRHSYPSFEKGGVAEGRGGFYHLFTGGRDFVKVAKI